MHLRTTDSAAEQYATGALAASELFDACRYFARDLIHPLVTPLMIQEDDLDALVAWNGRVEELLEMATSTWAEYQTTSTCVESLLDTSMNTRAALIEKLVDTLDGLLALRAEEVPDEPPPFLHLAAQAEECYHQAAPLFDFDHDARKRLDPEAHAIVEDISDEVNNHLSWVGDVLFEYQDGPASVHACEVELRHIREEIAARVSRFQAILLDPYQLREW